MRAESKPWLIRHWSRRATAWLVGAAALLAGGSAAAVVASSGSAPHNKPAAVQSDAARQTKNALDAILAGDPDVGRPVSALIDEGKLPKATYAGDNGTVGVPKGARHPAPAAAGGTHYVAGPLTGDFTLLQMASLALSQGCSPGEAPIAAAIGAAESAGNPGAQGDITLMDATWDWSEGLWQIRGLKSERGTGGLRDSIANADPVKNAKAMLAISSGCTDWTPWSTYNTGAYLSYLSLSKSAAAAAGEYKAKTGAYPPVGGGTGGASVPAAPPAPAKSTGATRRRHHAPTPKASRSSGSAHSRSPGAKSTSSAPNPAPSNLPTKTKTKTRSSAPGLPITVPPLPTKTPTLPIPVPTVTLPPLPPLPTLPKLP